MPTAAKLVAAVFFAALGYLMAEAFKPTQPEGMRFGYFAEISAGIGLLCGWIVMGPLVGRGHGRAWGLGVRTAITTVFFATILFATYEMVLRSMKLRYDGPMEAVIGGIGLILEYGTGMVDQRFILTVLIGGAIGGILTEWSSRRWT